MGRKPRAKTAVLEVTQSADKEWFFHWVDANKQVLLISGLYTTFSKAFTAACRIHEMVAIATQLVVPDSQRAALARYVKEQE